jgi:hypothetical protein
MRPCCDEFEDAVKQKTIDFNNHFFSWYVVESKGGGVYLDFCPFCGAYLNSRPSSAPPQSLTVKGK